MFAAGMIVYCLEHGFISTIVLPVAHWTGDCLTLDALNGSEPNLTLEMLVEHVKSSVNINGSFVNLSEVSDVIREDSCEIQSSEMHMHASIRSVELKIAVIDRY